LYPGARPQKDTEDDSPSAKFGLWGNTLAFKLAVLKLESSDPMDKIAAFCKKAAREIWDRIGLRERLPSRE